MDEARRRLKRVDPRVQLEGAELVVPEEHRGGVPGVHLFRAGRAAGTIVLWCVNFMNILVVYSLANWLATVVGDAGYATRTAVLISTTLQVGGTLGTFACAWCIARCGFIPVLATSFAVACVAIASIGTSLGSLALLGIMVFVAGWGSIGAQPGLNALSATFYPTYLRSTGVGWGLGFGRIGAIVGPIVGGELMRRQWSGVALCYAAAIPAAAAALGMLAMQWAIRREHGAERTTDALAH
jgi:AAHS family 4-hydroxybenzoate transporter-like MFS transporter